MTNPFVRRIFFWFLTLLFLLTAPAAVLYALGYRFNTERKVFVYGGSISIEANPLKVDIFLDDIPVSQSNFSLINNSYHISGVRPGEHQLRVTLPDFQSWSKKVLIRSGVSTEFWNVLLAREQYATTIYDPQSIDNFFLSPKRNLAAFTRFENGMFSVGIADLDADTSELAFQSEDFRFTKNEKENIEWDPNSRRIIVPVEKQDQQNYFIVNVETKELIDLEKYLDLSDISNVRWDTFDKNVVYFLSGNSLFQTDLSTKNETVKIAEQATAYDISSDSIYYLQLPNGIVYKKSLNDNGRIEQITNVTPPNMKDGVSRIIAYDDDRIAFISDSGNTLSVYNRGLRGEYFTQLSNNVTGASFSNDGKKLLMWNSWEISVHFLRDWEVQPVRRENDTLEITRLSQPIKNVQWDETYEHVIFSTPSAVKIVELDHRDRRNIQDIVALTATNAKVVYDTGKEKMYFTNNDSEGIVRLLSIDFPEKIGLFSRI